MQREQGGHVDGLPWPLLAFCCLPCTESIPFPAAVVTMVLMPFGMGPYLRSRPSCFHRTSMSWIICKVSMSWRRSAAWEGDHSVH